MSEHEPPFDAAGAPAGRALHFLSRLFALAGGILMAGLAMLTVVSVIGRWLFAAPVPGDFELVAAGTAVSVFLFLPYCHLRRGNVVIDLFLSRAPARLRALLDAAGSLLLMGLSGLIAWRMALGGTDARAYGETTYILALPLWWVYPAAVASFALLAANAAYMAVRDLKGVKR